MAIDPDVLQRMIDAGQRRIDRMRAELTLGPNDELSLPFRCYGCDEWRYDFCMMTGDGLPLCKKCFNGVEDAARGESNHPPAA